MLGIDISLPTLFRWFRPSARWLELEFLWVLGLLGLVGAHFLRSNPQFAGIASALPYSTLVAYGVYAVAPLALITCWFLGVHVYLCSGHGPKLGVVYEAFAVEEPHSQKVKQILHQLYNAGELRYLTSLRFLPRRAIANSHSRNRFIRRFNFSIIAHIEQSKTLDSNQPAFTVQVHLESKRADLPVVDGMIRAFVARQQVSSRKSPSILDLLKKRASTLSDLMLTLLAIQRLLAKEFMDASAILRHIEDSTPEALDPKKPPRAIVRELDAFSRVYQAQFSGSDIPDPDKLAEILLCAETASRYAVQFVWVANKIARLRFLSGDDAGALRIIDECLKGNSTAKRDPFILVAKAFLEFKLLRWNHAYDNYCRLLDNPRLFEARWLDDLVPFAAYVADIQTEGAQVIQVLYARLANCGVTSLIEAEAFAWIDEDTTRSCFHDLLERAPKVWSAHHSGVTASPKTQKKGRRKRRTQRKPGRSGKT